MLDDLGGVNPAQARWLDQLPLAAIEMHFEFTTRRYRDDDPRVVASHARPPDSANIGVGNDPVTDSEQRFDRTAPA